MWNIIVEHLKQAPIWWFPVGAGIFLLLVAILGEVRAPVVPIGPLSRGQRLGVALLGLLIGGGAIIYMAQSPWVYVGEGDCPGAPGVDLNPSPSATPLPGACAKDEITAICWDGGNCVYKAISWDKCVKGDNPGHKYRCVPHL